MMNVESNGDINPDNPVMRGLLAALNQTPEQREANLRRIEENNYNLNPEAYVRNRKRMIQKEINAIEAEIEKTNKLIELKDEKIAALKSEQEKTKAAIAANEVSKRVQASLSLVAQMKASVAAIKASKPSVAPIPTPIPATPAMVETDPAVAALDAALAKMFPKRK
ncbi:hypothetical protein EGJ52_08655 [Pseudomonas luteola]|uniref:hypothetical protein n=1 Tax=Pseudomonas luteola TaxID=47886 RepID=UPI000F76A751|nr:hypothetical protein [Pseudomonas luteola]RRW45080.1 hypothetical protein EGJ52_08655 [Pseudomonas luteola]